MAAILIVEDERLSAEEIASFVREAGHEVTGIAISGEHALSEAKEHPPDLALVDVKLRGTLDGIALAEKLQNNLDVGVIYVTGHSEESVLQRATQTAAYGYVLKPVDGRTLQASVEMALARRRRDQDLRLHGQWVANLLRNIGIAVLATDEQGAIRYANPLAVSLTGCSEREPIGARLRFVDESGRELRPIEDALQRSTCVDFPDGACLVRDRAPPLPVDGSVSPLYDALGRAHAVVVALRDGTERRNAERERLRAQRLDSLATLAAGVAHDFNNTLAIMLNCASLARQAAGDNAALDGLLDDLCLAGERASKLTAELAAFAKGTGPARKRLELSPLLERTVGLALRGAATRVEYSVTDGLWPLFADEAQLAQVLTNLVLNARQAMRDQGTLHVSATNREVRGKDGLVHAGRYVEISIRDEGPGISPEHLDRIFDPFFTTKPTGSGLGLASAYSIVTRHGGALRAHSTPGEGATFVLLLPAAHEQPKTPVERPRRRSSAPTGRILVMDDEDALRRIIALCLTDVGYRVEQAADGASALTEYVRAREAGDPFDAVILDLTVRGGMGGLDTLGRLKAVDPDVRAIAASGYNDSPVLTEYEQHGFVGALAKPFHFTMLVNLLRQVLPTDERV